MSEILVTYDIENDATREGVSGYLESFPIWHHMQKSVYIINADVKYKEIYDSIVPNLSKDDYLLVVDVTEAAGEQNGFIESSEDYKN
ncbi:MAG: CRISPR-associated endonuclease Cas2 [Alphaproteobacteria bacterium]|nr:CRISPR-associated endonuclease Cas2 [Alphaproteobacteria bacterium]